MMTTAKSNIANTMIFIAVYRVKVILLFYFVMIVKSFKLNYVHSKTMYHMLLCNENESIQNLIATGLSHNLWIMPYEKVFNSCMFCIQTAVFFPYGILSVKSEVL